MKTLKFNYVACFGKCDYSDPIPGEADISDKDWERLVRFHEEQPGESALKRPEFEKLWDLCYEEIIEKEIEGTIAWGDEEAILDYLEETREDFERDDYEITPDDVREYLEDTVDYTITEDGVLA